MRLPSQQKPSKSRFLTIRELCFFLVGCTLTATCLLNLHFLFGNEQFTNNTHNSNNNLADNNFAVTDVTKATTKNDDNTNNNNNSILNGKKILVAVAAYDFSQLPHLEELLDAYFDLVAAGCTLKVVVYCTIAWPVAFIDMLNTRFPLPNWSMEIHLKSPQTKLHLVDFHRTLFYDHLQDYDVFIYTEDDIRVSPGTVATYLQETYSIQEKLGTTRAHDFNVGIVRYEYNYPANLIIDDGTRHATLNVSRVYWEHSWRPPVPKSVDLIPQQDELPGYVHMQNHHQGMYLATRELLTAWRDKKDCEFNVIKNRPGLKNRPSQPAEGTQRVWMSSQQLYGGKHCAVQQVIPINKFGAMTVLHLPNKNYRRLGRKGRLGGGPNGTEPLQMLQKLPPVSSQLVTALELHVEFRKRWPAKPQHLYQGIQMLNQVEGRGSNNILLLRRMNEYQAYVDRGGVMSAQDMTKLTLTEEQ